MVVWKKIFPIVDLQGKIRRHMLGWMQKNMQMRTRTRQLERYITIKQPESKLKIKQEFIKKAQ